MAKRAEKNKYLKQRRTFSEAVRKQVVNDVESGKSTVLEASRELSVAPATVYRWLNKYSRFMKSNKALVVEDKSEASKTRKLEQENKELLAMIGRMQIEKELTERIIEEAGRHYGVDLKKNFSTRRSTGSSSTKG
jgi:transposase-like protein